MADRSLEFRLLGDLDARRGGVEVALGGRRQQALLAALLLEAGGAVSVANLVEAVWGGTEIDDPAAALQVYVSRLRNALDPERSGLIEAKGSGYRIAADMAEIDLHAHRDLLDKAHKAAGVGDPRAAATAFRNALGLWRGPFLGDHGDEIYFAPHRTRMEATHLNASLGAIEAEIDLDMYHDAVAELELVLAEHPLNEKARALHMVAMYRGGRQSDALASYGELRRRLVDELGIEPGPQLQELELQILNHDPALLSSTPATGFTETVVSADIPEAMAFLVLGRSRIPITAMVTTMGRRPNCDVVMPTPDVSRRHAEIRVEGGSYLFVDAGSTNGSSINGLAVTEPYGLHHGDEIKLGSTIVRFERA